MLNQWQMHIRNFISFLNFTQVDCPPGKPFFVALKPPWSKAKKCRARLVCELLRKTSATDYICTHGSGEEHFSLPPLRMMVLNHVMGWMNAQNIRQRFLRGKNSLVWTLGSLEGGRTGGSSEIPTVTSQLLTAQSSLLRALEKPFSSSQPSPWWIICYHTHHLLHIVQPTSTVCWSRPRKGYSAHCQERWFFLMKWKMNIMK